MKRAPTGIRSHEDVSMSEHSIPGLERWPRWVARLLGGGLAAAATAGLTACAGSHETTMSSELDRVAELRESGDTAGGEEVSLDGTLASYVAVAMQRSPELRASFERWRASVLRISRRRRLPEPTLSYSYFLRSVETRVGPQRHKLSIRQAFPWPTRLSAGADAASLSAQAAQRRFDGEALALQRRVTEAYYALWLIHRTHWIKLEQDQVLESLATSVRARVETGQASLADLVQLQLRIERHHDHRAAHGEAARAASARLAAAVGLPPGSETPTVEDVPAAGLPEEDEEALRAAATEHPRVHAHDSLAEASDASAEGEEAARLPTFVLGLDWIETGPAGTPGMQDSGKDPLIVSMSVQLPIWFGSYTDAEDAAHAEAAAHRADGEAARQAALAELEVALSDLRDSERRIRLFEGTLIPQSETVYASVLGGYHTASASVSQLLLAVQDVLELQELLARAQAEHAAAWARLEHIVGRPVSRREMTDDRP